MKKIFLAAIVFLVAQSGFAASFNRARIVEQFDTHYSKIIQREKLKSGNAFGVGSKFRELVTASLTDALKNSRIGNVDPFLKLINSGELNGQIVFLHIAEIAHRINVNIKKNDLQSKTELTIANKELELLALAANKIETLVKPETPLAKAQEQIVKDSLTASQNMAKMSTYNSDVAKKCASTFETALLENNTLDRSIELAIATTRGKVRKEITKEDILNCI